MTLFESALISLISLICVFVVVIGTIITIALVKLLKTSVHTMTSIKELVDITKEEMQPAFKSVNGILDSVNNITTSTNKQFETVKKLISTVIGATYMAYSGLKGKGGLINGILTGFNFFRKKGDKKCQ